MKLSLLGVVLIAGVAVAAPAHAEPPIVGGQGLTPAARAVAEHVRANYPGVHSIGGVRPCDWIGEHCRGLAVDIMVGADMVLGDAVHRDVCLQKSRWGISYCLWRVQDHFNHIHISVGSSW